MLEDNKMFGAWLKKIVVNSSITALRKKNTLNEVALETVEYGLSDTDGVAEEDLTQIRANTVLSTLKQLKESYSTALSLHLIEGYDYEEICEIMNISYSNCRTLVFARKRKLTKKITAGMKEDNIEKLFERMKGQLDIFEPADGHETRFLDKLQQQNKVVQLSTKKKSWYKPLAIAASIAVLLGVATLFAPFEPKEKADLASVSPQMEETQTFFTSAIQQQLEEIDQISSAETNALVKDAMNMLEQLESDL